MQEPEVRPVAGSRDFKRFIAYQYDRNRSDARFIPPLRIGEADVLAGGDQHAPKDEAGVFAGLHHAGQPEQGGVGIAAPERLDEGADGVEVGVALLVVEHRPLLDHRIR